MSKQVLLFASNESAAISELEGIGGRVVHKFAPSAFVAELPQDVDPSSLTAATTQAPGSIDYPLQLAINAWQANKMAPAAAPTATEGLQWDTPGYQPPIQLNLPGPNLSLTTGVMESTGTPTSLHLTGSVAVGLVLVSRDQGVEAMSESERIKIIQEVQTGLGWLSMTEPRARLTWSYDIRPVTITTGPGPYPGGADPYEQLESGWRDQALSAMGYASGRTGYQNYVTDLRTSKGTNWAYVAFFTKYNINHFAYAIFEKVVMSYANDGWGPDNIHRVFAHESCHIFGAADEYGNCSCGGSHGHLGVPNNNCINCFPPGSQEGCLMNANTLSLCSWSRKQVGWDPSLFPAG